MSLENFKMPSFLIPELYEKVLIGAKTEAIEKKASKGKVLSSLGNNQKRVMLVVKEENAVFLSDEDLKFLTGILTACKLNMSDIALVNIFHYPATTYTELVKSFDPLITIYFGADDQQLQFPSQSDNFEISIQQNKTILLSHSLQHIANNIEDKKRLWNCLKTIFSV